MTRAPARDLGVAPDGSGECTPIQAAGDAVSANSTARAASLVRRGRYAALVVVPREKQALTLHPTIPRGGSPAGAIRVRADRVVGRDGSIEGDVDGVCGGGTVSFDRGTF